MKTFDLKGTEINASFQKAFEYISNPNNLPLWTKAFKQADKSKAIMLDQKNGEISVRLKVQSSNKNGTIDWHMEFPNGNLAKAYSRLIEIGVNKCVYTFTLMAPPVALEDIEGALNQQSKILDEELKKLKLILEN